MDRLTREILEKIAKEIGKPPDDPQVLQVVYRMVWEVATGQKPAEVKREPNPLLPPKEDPAVRPPDAQDLTDLVDSILEDPRPKTEFLARPQDVAVNQSSTGVWLKDLLTDLKGAPKDSDKRKQAREWVPAPKGERPDVEPFRPAPPAADLAALVSPGPLPPPAPVASRPAPPERKGPRFAKRGARSESPGEVLTAEEAAKNAPAWCAAAALHFIIAVVLMNIVYFTTYHRSGDVFRVSLSRPVPPPPAPAKVPEIKDGTQDHGLMGKENEDSAPAGKVDQVDPTPAGVRLPEIPDDVRAPSISLGNLPDAPGVGTSGRDGLGGLYAGRGGRRKQEALRRNGGSDETEAAVERGLRWLAKHQAADGSWGSLTGFNACHTEPSCGGMAARCPVGVTALALLAFAGAGYTHLDGEQAPYTATIKKAAEYLCSRQTKDGLFEETDYHPNYTHAIVTLALCELLGMSQDPRLRPVCDRAIAHLASCQQENGGWDYEANATGRGDVSITGWVVMALRAARAAGLGVPPNVWAATRRFYSTAVDEQTGDAAYFVANGQRNGGSPAIQVSAVLARGYLGMPRGAKLESRTLETLAKTPPVVANPPRSEANEWHRTFYYVYYATLVSFYQGGNVWEGWNASMKRELLPMQIRAGHEEGSWPTCGRDAGYGGRCYTTAMAILNLEVYYRYLPSYKAEADIMAPLEDPGAKAPSARVRPDMPVDELVDLLRSSDTAVKRAASRELCRRREEGALGALIAAARAETTSLKALLIEDLAAFGDNERSLAALVGWLDEDHTRASAIRALRKATGLQSDTADAWREWWAGRKR